jgi:hypothetical protein
MTRRAVGAWLCVMIGSSTTAARAQDVVVQPPSTPPPSAPEPAPPAALPPPPAEPPSADEREARNALYVEALGPALFYSVNYERAIADFALRIGVGAFSSGDSSWLGVPVTLSYIGIGSKKHIFEAGAGVSIQYFSGGSDTLNFNAGAGSAQVLGTVILGYRLQPPKGGFMLRAGVAPLFGQGSGSGFVFIPWPYLSFGAAFR